MNRCEFCFMPNCVDLGRCIESVNRIGRWLHGYEVMNTGRAPFVDSPT